MSTLARPIAGVVVVLDKKKFLELMESSALGRVKMGVSPMRAVVVATTPANSFWQPSQKDVITPSHAFAITGYNFRTNEVTVRNPQPDPSRKYGMTFTMKLDEFLRTFRLVVAEKRS